MIDILWSDKFVQSFPALSVYVCLICQDLATWVGSMAADLIVPSPIGLCSFSPTEIMTTDRARSFEFCSCWVLSQCNGESQGGTKHGCTVEARVPWCVYKLFGRKKLVQAIFINRKLGLLATVLLIDYYIGCHVKPAKGPCMPVCNWICSCLLACLS